MNAQHPIPPQPAVDELSLLPGVNVLLEGPGGSGKTYSLGTLIETGLEVFCLFTENGRETLMGYFTDRGQKIPENLHWFDLPRAATGFDELIKGAEDVNRLPYDALLKQQDPNRTRHNHFITMLRQMNNFRDSRTGKEFGRVADWGPDKALVIDSLSGLNTIAMSLVIGNKPVKAQHEWGIAQDQLERLLIQLCDACPCHFICLGHVERETDMTGMSKLTISTLGRALAPKIPPKFSDVILSVREGTKFTWSTANVMADLKARNLPIADGLPPDFRQIIEKWKSRGGRFTSKVKS